MKKITTLLAIILVSFVFFTSCKKEKSPEEVVERFFIHLNNKDFKEAKKLGTENTVKVIEFFETVSSIGTSFVDDEELYPSMPENLNCEVEKNKAVCIFIKNGLSDRVYLVKKDDKWLIDLRLEFP